jgi:hypothetical protein
VKHFSTGSEFRDYFKAGYGPTIVTYRAIADDPGRTAALDQALTALGDGRGPNGPTTPQGWEYLLLTAVRV